ncbi:hypothetical protein NQ317_014571 [Molorchus minor]|uniref:Uncharacterized protein n=1 Tax=Molorchus minor TaxID=1323400 RepID=A0ABQ9JVG5_9CUCU|nr:hypothetical protein NQ317_014571 [Molorchus minor]
MCKVLGNRSQQDEKYGPTTNQLKELVSGRRQDLGTRGRTESCRKLLKSLEVSEERPTKEWREFKKQLKETLLLN